MAGEAPNGREYKAARKWAAAGLFGLVIAIVLADALSMGRPVEPLILTPLLLTALGLLAVDVPGLRR